MWLQVDSLNEEVARFKAVSRVSDQDGHMKDALEKQIEEHRELHQKQVRLSSRLLDTSPQSCLKSPLPDVVFTTLSGSLHQCFSDYSLFFYYHKQNYWDLFMYYGV